MASVLTRTLASPKPGPASPDPSPKLTVADFIVAGLVIAAVAAIYVAMFHFGVTNVTLTVRKLGVPAATASSIGPVSEGSVSALLIPISYLSWKIARAPVHMQARLRAQLRSSVVMLWIGGLVMLALNIGEPLSRHDGWQAAAQAVCPAFAIGWGHVGTGLLRMLFTPIPVVGPESEPESGPESAVESESSPDSESGPESGSASPGPRRSRTPNRTRRRTGESGRSGLTPVPSEDDIAEATRIAREYERENGRPITRDALRYNLGCINAKATALARALRERGILSQ